MSLAKWILVAVLALPVAEVAVFIAVAGQIGVLAALALCVATSLLGLAVLRAAGRQQLAHIRVALADGAITETEFTAAGFLTGLAGILLLLPGFLTDVLGFLLLLPAVQQRLGAAFRRVVRRRRQAGEGVVELEPGEWSRVDDGKPDDRRRELPRD